MVDCEFVTGVFELTVMGKNGVTVNGILHTPSSAPQQLYTQDFLQVGEQKFFFLLPKGTSRSALLVTSPDTMVRLLRCCCLLTIKCSTHLWRPSAECVTMSTRSG